MKIKKNKTKTKHETKIKKQNEQNKDLIRNKISNLIFVVQNLNIIELFRTISKN